VEKAPGFRSVKYSLVLAFDDAVSSGAIRSSPSRLRDMVDRNAVGVLRCGALLAATLVLAGCPIPLPARYESSSRENLPAEPLDWVTVGVTTREDVLLKLARPTARHRTVRGSLMVRSTRRVACCLCSLPAAAPPEEAASTSSIAASSSHSTTAASSRQSTPSLKTAGKVSSAWARACAEPAVPEGRLPRVISVTGTWRQRRLAPCCDRPRAWRSRQSGDQEPDIDPPVDHPHPSASRPPSSRTQQR